MRDRDLERQKEEERRNCYSKTQENSRYSGQAGMFTVKDLVTVVMFVFPLVLQIGQL